MRKVLCIVVALIIVGWLYNEEVIPHERPVQHEDDVVQFDAAISQKDVDEMVGLVMQEIARRLAREQGEGAFQRSFWHTAKLDGYRIQQHLASKVVIDMAFVNQTPQADKHYVQATFSRQQRLWQLLDLQILDLQK